MKKAVIVTLIFAVLTVIFMGLAQDMQTLQSNVIRLHVVGASDSEADQRVKLEVKDAVVCCLEDMLSGVQTLPQAQEILEENLDQIGTIANQTLKAEGFSETVTVTLEPEEFPRRDYETFSLPAGVYTSLRIRIGEAQGKNWWCVVFPSLCFGAASEDLRDTAAGAGFSDELTDTITNEPQYEIRFFLLDCLGQLQNFFHAG